MIDKQALPLLSRLLQYPESLVEDFEVLCQEAEKLENPHSKDAVRRFLVTLQSKEWIAASQEYVATFDFNEGSNLYLTSLSCAEERKRGQLLAGLNGIYHQAGLELATGELPDYLPLVLEFLTVAGEELTSQVLEITGVGMGNLWQQLVKMQSCYSGILEACLLSLRIPFPVQTSGEEGGLS